MVAVVEICGRDLEVVFVRWGCVLDRSCSMKRLASATSMAARRKEATYCLVKSLFC